MRSNYLYIICLFVVVFACDETDIRPTPPTQQGEVLSISMATRSGEPELPAGDYGLFGIEHAYNQSYSWNSWSFYLENKRATLNNDELDFGSSCRYPINDYLAVFLYYPYNSTITVPNVIPIDRITVTDSGTGDIISDKYPDYLGGTQNISVVGGAPNIPSETTVEMSHLMSRVRFQTRNTGVNDITLLSVKLVGITWEGTINPHKTGTDDYFTPSSSGSPETITLMTQFLVPGNISGNANVAPRPIQIDSIYNYSDAEAAFEATFDANHKYYMLVPPLSEEALKDVKLEVQFSRYGASYTTTIEMRQISIPQWLPGNSYCYTLTFSTHAIEYIDAKIEPWLKELYTGPVM